MSLDQFEIEFRNYAIKKGFYRPDLDYKKDSNKSIFSEHKNENKNENKIATGDNFTSSVSNSEEYNAKIQRLKKELKREKIREQREKSEYEVRKKSIFLI